MTAPSALDVARAQRLGRATARAGRDLSTKTCPFDANGSDIARVLAARFVQAYLAELPGESATRSGERAAGHDTHPGGEELKHYWTKDPEGLAKWVGTAHPWTALYEQLLEHMDGNVPLAKATAGKWYYLVFGHGPTAGHDKDRRARVGALADEIEDILTRKYKPEHFPAGTPGGKGGEFMPADGQAVPAKNALIDKLMDVAGISTKTSAKKAISAKKAAAKKTAGRAPAKPIPIRELFAADDATIDAALRDVYEGKFGPYTTKVKTYITRAGTKIDNRGGEYKVEPSISVDGKIYDAQGREIGYFDRSVTLVDMHYPDGRVRREMWAGHRVVQLGEGDEVSNPTKYHGKGFGGEFNRRAIEWYRASGVHGIGQSDHNGYVWASQGFGFTGGVVPEYLVDNVRQLISDLRAGKTRSDATKDAYRVIPRKVRKAPDLEAQIGAAEALLAKLASTKPGEPDYPTATEFSQLGRTTQSGKTGVWLGKLLFVPADEMILNPDEGEEVLLQRSAALRVQPDRVVVERQNALFDLWSDFAIAYGDDPDYDPDDDPDFVEQARAIMGLSPIHAAADV